MSLMSLMIQTQKGGGGVACDLSRVSFYRALVQSGHEAGRMWRAARGSADWQVGCHR